MYRSAFELRSRIWEGLQRFGVSIATQFLTHKQEAQYPIIRQEIRKQKKKYVNGFHCVQNIQRLYLRFFFFINIWWNIGLIQSDQKVSVHLMITIHKVTSIVQSVHRLSPDNYWHGRTAFGVSIMFPNSNYPITVSDWNCLKYCIFTCFYTVIVRCTKTFWSPCIWSITDHRAWHTSCRTSSMGSYWTLQMMRAFS